MGLGVSDIRTAASGKEALRLLAERSCEFVFTDMWMPEMDGMSLARAIRANPTFALIRIVAVIADMSVFDAMVTKPVTGEKLRTVLGEMGGKGECIYDCSIFNRVQRDFYAESMR